MEKGKEGRYCRMIKISLPNEITSTAATCTLHPLFRSLPRPLHSMSRPPNSLPSILRSQGLLQLRGSGAVETRWFRWKEIDVLFTIAVTLLPRRTQPIANNYLGRQLWSHSWTGTYASCPVSNI